MCKFFLISSLGLTVFTALQNFIAIKQKRRKYGDFQKMLSDPCLNTAEYNFSRKLKPRRGNLHMSRYWDVPLFWVLFGGAPGFLGTFLGCSRIFGYLFGLFLDFGVSFFW